MVGGINNFEDKWMKHLTLINILVFGMMSCQNNADPPKAQPKEGKEQKINSESVKGVDQHQSVDSAAIRLREVLENPLDLARYKADYGPANSGGYDLDTLVYYHPEREGFYYRYMLFYGLKKVIPNLVSEESLFHNFRILVYHFGGQVGRFSDTTETLIAIECAMENPTLGDLDLYGRSKTTVENRFGMPTYQKTDYWIYQIKNRVLVISFDEKMHCRWWRFSRIKEGIDVTVDQPEDLTTWQ